MRDIQQKHFPSRSLNKLYYRLSLMSKHPKRATAWSSTEIEEVLRLYHVGATYEDIARSFPDRTWEAVESLLKRLR